MVFWSAASLAKTVKPSVEASLFFPRPGASASGDRIYTGFLHEEARRGGGEQPPPADAKIESQFFREICISSLAENESSPGTRSVQQEVRASMSHAACDGRAGTGVGDLETPGDRDRGLQMGLSLHWFFLLQFFLSSFSSSAFRRQGTDAGFRGRLGPRSPSPSGTAPASCACPWRPGS